MSWGNAHKRATTDKISHFFVRAISVHLKETTYRCKFKCSNGVFLLSLNGTLL